MSQFIGTQTETTQSSTLAEVISKLCSVNLDTSAEKTTKHNINEPLDMNCIDGTNWLSSGWVAFLEGNFPCLQGHLVPIHKCPYYTM